MNPDEKKSTALIPVEGERLPAAPPVRRANYWGRISSRYTALSRVMILLLLLFVVLFSLIFARMFTYDSLFSFVKDIQNVSSFVPANYETVYATYDGADAAVTVYRGSIAFVTKGGVEVYAPDGTRLLNLDRELASPRVVASEKYLIAYDQGGKSFFVTNSYGELYSGESAFPILSATVADSGYFALITTSDSYLSRVVLYDNNFNQIRGINRGMATVGAVFLDDGSLALLGATAADGAIYTSLSIYDSKLESVAYSCELENEMPLALGLADGTLMLLTDKALHACDTDGSVKNSVTLEGALVNFAFGREGAVLVSETDAVTATHRVVALNGDGVLVYDDVYNGDVYAVEVVDEALLLLCKNAVVRIPTDGSAVQTVAVEAGATDILSVGERGLRVIYPAKAVFVDFEDS